MGKEQRDNTTDLIVTKDGQGRPSAEENVIKEKTVDSNDADSGDDLEKEGRKRKQRESRKRRSKKGNHVARTFLRIVQHVALAAMVVSVFIVAIGSTVYVEGFRSKGSFNMYTMDRKQKYEESELFDNILVMRQQISYDWE